MNSSVLVQAVGKRIRLYALEQLNVPARDAQRGIVPIAELEKDLAVQVPKGSDLYADVQIRLFKDRIQFGAVHTVTQGELDDPNLTYFTLYIRQSDFPPQGGDETFDLNYSVMDPISEEEEFSDKPVRVRIDRRAPGGSGLPAIFFTEDQLTGITEADLEDDALTVEIKPYREQELEDEIQLWLGETEDEASGSWLTPTFPVTDSLVSTFVTFTRDQLISVGDGRRYFAYRATDWAGNIAERSGVVGIDVYLQLPELFPPLVPEGDDGLVTYNDAVPDVDVDIPAYSGASEGDRILVAWGARSTSIVTLRPEDVGNDPLITVKVPYSLVSAEGNGTVTVTYTVFRSGQPADESPATTVEVDLTTPGGPDPDPDPGTPEHENIKPPQIKVGNSPVNTISADDYGQDGVATIFRQGQDNGVIWEVGDSIQLHWGQLSEPEIPAVEVTAATEGANIDIPVQFATVIDVVGVGTIPVYFTITRVLRTGTPPITVTVQSPPQEVTVVSRAALPGGGSLAAAIFPEANDRNIINKKAGDDGTTFRIELADVENIEAGRNPTYSYNFVGIQDSRVPPTPPDPAAAPIEQSRISGTDVPISQQDLTRGYIEIALPYGKTFYICRNWALVDYSITNDLGTTQATQGNVYFAMNQGGGSCTPP